MTLNIPFKWTMGHYLLEIGLNGVCGLWFYRGHISLGGGSKTLQSLPEVIKTPLGYGMLFHGKGSMTFSLIKGITFRTVDRFTLNSKNDQH